MPAIPTTHGNGVVNLRGASGSRRRITSIAVQTAMKAASVPALATAAIVASGKMPAMIETATAVNKVIRTGLPRLETRAELRRDQAVARHDEEDPALAVEEGEDHGRERDHRRDAEDFRRPALADLAKDQRQRLGRIGEPRIGQRADRDRRDGHVDQHAQHHRSDDPDGKVAIRILGFFGGRRDGVEAVECEEDDGRRGHHPDFAPGRPGARKTVGHERREIVGVEHRQSDGDEHRQSGEFHRDQHRVQGRAFARAGDQQAGNHDDDEDRRQIDNPARLRALHQVGRQAHSDRLQEARRHSRTSRPRPR